MVGVAGKSHACKTCKRRRVKCDLQQPTCFRCEKANTTCDGYGREPIFVNRTLSHPFVKVASVISEAKHAESKTSHLPLYEEDMRSMISQATNPSPYIPIDFRRKAVELLRKIYLPKKLVAEGYRERHWHAVGGVYAWLACLRTLTEKSKALDLALLAFCIVQTHVTKTSSVNIEDGLQFYSEAICHYRCELQDDRKRSRNESFATIIVLITCELFTFQVDQSWRVHAFGISEILRLRNRSELPSETWNILCSRMRIVCILDGLTKQQPLFLSSGEWLEISSSVYFSPIDRLLDIVINIPASLARSNALMDTAHPEQHDYELASILTDFMCVSKQMHIWQHRTKAEGPLIPYWAVFSQIHNPADDEYASKLFPFALEFDSLDSAITFSFKWSVHLQILTKIICIHRWLDNNRLLLPRVHGIFGSNEKQKVHSLHASASNYGNPSTISISFIKAEADKLSRLLCQCIGYCYRTEMGTLGPQYCRYLLWATRQFFGLNADYKRELEWSLQIKNITGPGLHAKLDLMELEDNL
ncbi:hypothetical protein OIDMADRAFT_52664 [Oidiodendron maius Zn]|uniref:Zn(2)-C6 fungal-type domain-containing protein n=1 Tax=Oidiodendron maius (strain Zn) TaxID=913774 RepID=A0A0C3HKH2_OIDMZ|nr:hypothetical protein OIDMADRAFT_52664 [Oidiodendron maius Zn]